MADIKDWANTAAGNNTGSPPDYPVEGMPASAVNDTQRENMAAVRRHAEDGGWFNWGHNATFVDSDTFQVPGDLSAVYTAGRRVRIAQTATVYGTIASVEVTANTAVTVALDSGTIANEAMEVSVGLEPGVGASPTPGAYNLLAMQTVSNVTEIVFTDADYFLSNYISHRLVFTDIEPSLAGNALQIQVSIDGGTSWVGAGGYSDVGYGVASSTGNPFSYSDAGIGAHQPAAPVDSFVIGETHLHNARANTATTEPRFYSEFSYLTNAGNMNGHTTHGRVFRGSTAAVNGIRITLAPGNISGTVALYGMADK